MPYSLCTQYLTEVQPSGGASEERKQAWLSARLERLFCEYGTDRGPQATVVAENVHIARLEVHYQRTSRGRSEGRRPVVAVGTRSVKVGITVASGGKEDTVAVLACH